jgi:hypothetical protein
MTWSRFAAATRAGEPVRRRKEEAEEEKKQGGERRRRKEDGPHRPSDPRS